MKISSIDNPSFKSWKRLLEGKGLSQSSVFLLTGQKLIEEYLQSPKFEIECELVPPDGKSISGTQSVYYLSQQLFQQVDSLGTHFNILVLKQPKIQEWDHDSLAVGAEVWLPLGDPKNLGACLRSCEAFGVNTVVLTQEAAHPFLPTTIKASAGSCLRVNLKWGPSLHKIQTKMDKSWISLDLNGTNLQQFNWPEQFRLLIGEEGPGLPQSLSTLKITIPTFQVESLNATVAASIALYSWRTSKQIKT